MTTVLILGSGPGVDILIEDESVSPRHALIRPVPQGLVIEDMGSANGTVVNGYPIAAPAEARAGSMVAFGNAVRYVGIANDGSGGILTSRPQPLSPSGEAPPGPATPKPSNVPPSAPPPPGTSGMPQGPTLPSERNAKAARTDVPTMVLLSVVTLEIWWLVWLYRQFPIYRRIAGRDFGKIRDAFWVYVICSIGIFVVSFFATFGALGLTIVAIGSGVYMISGLTDVRDVAAKTFSLDRPLPSKALIVGSFIAAQVIGAVGALPIVPLSWTLISLLISLVCITVFFYLTFIGQKKVIAAAQAQGFDWA